MSWSDRMYAALIVPRDALIVRRWKWQSGRYDDVVWWDHDADCLDRYNRALWYLVKRGIR